MLKKGKIDISIWSAIGVQNSCNIGVAWAALRSTPLTPAVGDLMEGQV